MALNMYKKYDEAKTREWPVASGTLAGVVVLHPVSSEVGVTLTARGDATTSQTLPDGTTLSGIPIGGVGNRPNTAVVAVDGSFLLSVVGVTAGDTNAASGGGTASGTIVYRVTADGTYSLTSTSAVQIGVVDDGTIVGLITPVLIGASANDEA
jgi:hypothetical protein